MAVGAAAHTHRRTEIRRHCHTIASTRIWFAAQTCWWHATGLRRSLRCVGGNIFPETVPNRTAIAWASFQFRIEDDSVRATCVALSFAWCIVRIPIRSHHLMGCATPIWPTCIVDTAMSRRMCRTRSGLCTADRHNRSIYSGANERDATAYFVTVGHKKRRLRRLSWYQLKFSQTIRFSRFNHHKI